MPKITTRNIPHFQYENPQGDHLGEWKKLLTEETSQVNLFIMNPLSWDGWHIHGEREEWYVCIKGNVLIALDQHGAVPTGELNEQAVFVPNLVGHGIYNASDEPAWVLVLSDQPHQMGEDEFPLPISQSDLDTLETLWGNYYGE